MPLEQSFVDLGMSPLCESILAPTQLDESETFFPLHVLVCSHCFLVQLREYVRPERIFKEYAYFSSYSRSWVAHAKAYADMMCQRLNLDRRSLVIEIGSNDGYLLQHFLPHGMRVLGIDPAANVAATAIEKGIPTKIDFFGNQLASEVVRENGPADLVIGNNVLAQVPELNDFVAGIGQLLSPSGIATLEFPHLQRLVEGNQFDTIYHEHFSYFSFLAFERLAQQHGLRLIDVEELPTHGGSLRVYLAGPQSVMLASPRVAKLLEREQALGYGAMAGYRSFAARVRQTKRRLVSLLVTLKDANKRICGYGAPGKGNTLLNYCGIGMDFIDFTVDRNPHKHGKYLPGTHIPILPVESIDALRPDYVLILPWNLKQEIVEQMRHIADWGGRFIVPIPLPTIVDPRESHT
jgi:SAM-dependent methyltransferase